MLLAGDTEADYAELCKLDVLEIKDQKTESRNDEVYQEFKE